MARGEDHVLPIVFRAIEALYFQPRGGKLGRTVLMVDEISKVDFAASVNATLLSSVKSVHEEAAYRIIGKLVDTAPFMSRKRGRRGCVITALHYIEAGALTSTAGRNLLWLPLGTFDVWNKTAQHHIAQEAMTLESNKPHRLLEVGQEVHASIWSLLAATGGRPRDILAILKRLHKDGDGVTLVNPAKSDILIAFYRKKKIATLFQAYLLPSMLGMPFQLFDDVFKLTQFGASACNPALLNADQLVDDDQVDDAVPKVSLQYARRSPAAVRSTMMALVEATAFFSLDGLSGKDFERVWVLLVFAHLQLQHNVRVGNSAMHFWPTIDSGRRLGGPERPTAIEIEVFQKTGVQRLNSLFEMPARNRIHKEPLTARKIMFSPAEPPTLAIWDDLWVPNVQGGDTQAVDLPTSTCDVVWRRSTLVVFSKVIHIASTLCCSSATHWAPAMRAHTFTCFNAKDPHRPPLKALFVVWTSS
jgi:hypothetical protein